MQKIEVELDECMMQGMSLAHGEKFLICAHQQGYVTVVNLEDYSVQLS